MVPRRDCAPTTCCNGTGYAGNGGSITGEGCLHLQIVIASRLRSAPGTKQWLKVAGTAGAAGAAGATGATGERSAKTTRRQDRAGRWLPFLR
jgi:hypothetical protein